MISTTSTADRNSAAKLPESDATRVHWSKRTRTYLVSNKDVAFLELFPPAANERLCDVCTKGKEERSRLPGDGTALESVGGRKSPVKKGEGDAEEATRKNGRR